MRTTLEIPKELLDEARHASQARTNREVVIAGLEELIRRYRREDLRKLAGQIDLKLDVDRSRKRKGR